MRRSSLHLNRLFVRSAAVALIAALGVSGTMSSAQADPIDLLETTTHSTALSSEIAARRVVKPAHAKLHSGASRDLVQVKFLEGTDVRLEGAKVTSASTSASTSSISSVLRDHPGTVARPLFAASENELTATQQQREATSGRPQADLTLYYELQVAKGDSATELVDDLNALDIVEIAYLAPLPPASPTPDFSNRQGYASTSTAGGIDAAYAHSIAGGNGQNVRIVDIEYAWNRTHEDLSRLRATGSAIANGSPCSTFDNNHGTAVIGEIAADNNGFGVTGLVPSAWIGTVNALRWMTNSSGQQYCGYDLANAIYTASRNMSPGDVMLLEQQIAGPNAVGGDSQDGLVAVEWIPAYYDAIVSATSAGIIVVEAAGNGSQNLDASVYGTVFPLGKADSGAIIVGAGSAPGCTSPARSRMYFSNYGSRVDVQGWGECVATTGYGNLQGGAENGWYTASFGGTSSASPIVTSAAAMLSSIAQQRGVTLTPRQVRSILKSTGQAQSGTGNIGPLPNLRSAIASLSGGNTGTLSVTAPTHEIIPGTTLSTTVPVRVRWTPSTTSIQNTSLSMKINGGSWVNQTLSSVTAKSKTFSLTPASTYEFAVRVQDTAGTWSPWSYGPAFRGDTYQENQYATYAPTANWTRPAYSAASGGYVNLASVSGSTANFTFTGRSVAWVGTKATNRGQAAIYLDGQLQETIDLYSATTLPQQVIASYVWPTSGQHTISVVVMGTAGRPKVDIDAFVRLK
jgi:hypothetical protein